MSPENINFNNFDILKMLSWPNKTPSIGGRCNAIPNVLLLYNLM